LSLLAWDLWLLGYPDQALGYLARALAATESESHPFWRASGWFYALRVYMCLRPPQTLELARRLAAYSKEQGISQMGGIAPLFVLWGHADQGRAIEAVSKIDVTKSESYRGEPTPGWVALMMAEMFAKAGNPVDGLTLVARGLLYGDEFGYPSHQAELHRLNGELLLMGEPSCLPQAERCFQTALDIARAQSAKSWELRATMSLARLLATQNRRYQARAILTDIYGWFTEGFDTLDLKDARSLLDQLSA